MEINKIIQHNVLDPWPIEDKSVNCIITSPPYWALRDYGVEGQLGKEPTPDAYIENMVTVFMEAHRVLRDDGTLWINIGDSYASTGKHRTEEQASKKSTLNGVLGTQLSSLKQQSKIVSGLKPKDLVGAPAQYKDAHFAVFPPALIVDPIKAGCPIGGTVLDPFMGSGTTGLVAWGLQRNYLGLELNPKYIKMAEKRIKALTGMFDGLRHPHLLEK